MVVDNVSNHVIEFDIEDFYKTHKEKLSMIGLDCVPHFRLLPKLIWYWDDVLAKEVFKKKSEKLK